MSASFLLRTLFFLALLAALPVIVSAFPSARAEEGWHGRATVIEGDVIEVAGRALRLFGIDAPEPDQRCRLKGKPYRCGEIARTALMDLTAGAEVSCAPSGARRHGLALARCSAGGFDLSRNMVHTGWALADPETGERYRATQAKAEAARRGLWRGRFVAPWEWRAGKRLAASDRAPD